MFTIFSFSLALSSFFFFIFLRSGQRLLARNTTFAIDDSQSWQQIDEGEGSEHSARNRLSLLQRRRYHESRSTTNARDADAAASLTLDCGKWYTNVLLFRKLALRKNRTISTEAKIKSNMRTNSL